MSALAVCTENPNMVVPYLLMASYLYYHCDQSPPTSDAEFDQLCKLALKHWRTIKHRHKRLIKIGDLKAGTLYALPLHKYPLITRNAAFAWLDTAGGVVNE